MDVFETREASPCWGRAVFLASSWISGGRWSEMIRGFRFGGGIGKDDGVSDWCLLLLVCAID